MTAVHPPALLDALEQAEIGCIRGSVWRQVLVPTSALRSNIRGARWNPPNTEALYCSLDPATAAAEVDHLLAAQPVPITRQRISYEIAVELSRVADLRDPGWNTTPFGWDYDITADVDCAAIGAAADWLGLDGLLAPSLRAPAANLVIYPANVSADDHYDLADPPDGHPYPPGPPVDATWPHLERC